MITLHLPDGKPVAINPIAVFAIHPYEFGTLIVSLGGAQMIVGDKFEEVQARLKAWVKE